jgi:hypothetical protein
VSVTVRDDDVLRTHDEAYALLRYVVTGATVRIYRREHGREKSRSYEITVRPHGREDVAVLGSYALPVRAAALASDARTKVESALAAR